MSHPEILHDHGAKDWLLSLAPIDAQPVDRLRQFQVRKPPLMAVPASIVCPSNFIWIRSAH